MSSLAETQQAFLQRDVHHGLVPPQLPKETKDTYHQRMAALYKLSKHTVDSLL